MRRSSYEAGKHTSEAQPLGNSHPSCQKTGHGHALQILQKCLAQTLTRYCYNSSKSGYATIQHSFLWEPSVICRLLHLLGLRLLLRLLLAPQYTLQLLQVLQLALPPPHLSPQPTYVLDIVIRLCFVRLLLIRDVAVEPQDLRAQRVLLRVHIRSV